MSDQNTQVESVQETTAAAGAAADGTTATEVDVKVQTSGTASEAESVEAAPEQQPEAESLLGEGEGSESEQSDEGAPEAYELEVPEGSSFEKGSVVRDAYEKVARELNLSQGKAQQVLAEVLPAMQKHHVAQVNAWAEEVRSDPDIGGEKLDDTLRDAKRALKADPTGEAAELLRVSGYGNNRSILRLLSKLGSMIGEDSLETGDPTKDPGQQTNPRFSKRGQLNP